MATHIKLFMLALGALCLGSCDGGPEASGGEALFKKKCATCHSLTPGKHGVGPSLAGVFDRKAGSSDFTKYKALKGADFAWTEENLNAWIADPKAFIQKPTAMTVKVKTQDERDQILDFIEHNGGRNGEGEKGS